MQADDTMIHEGPVDSGTLKFHRTLLRYRFPALAVRRLTLRVEGEPDLDAQCFRDPMDVVRLIGELARGVPHEQFWVVLMDGRHRYMGHTVVSQGTLTASLVHPREVFRTAIVAGAAAMIVAHNHPSGEPKPSEEDHRVTRRLCRAGELLGVPVLDHVVVSGSRYVSLRALGEIPHQPDA